MTLVENEGRVFVLICPEIGLRRGEVDGGSRMWTSARPLHPCGS